MLDLGSDALGPFDGGAMGLPDVGVENNDLGVRDASARDAEPPMQHRCNVLRGRHRGHWDSAFRKVTDAWGLAGVEGEYFNITDVDGDSGLMSLSKGRRSHDFSRDGVRHKWLLRIPERATEDPTAEPALLIKIEPQVSYGRPGKVLVSGDVDNDGDLDVFIGQGRTNPDNDEASFGTDVERRGRYLHPWPTGQCGTLRRPSFESCGGQLCRF